MSKVDQMLRIYELVNDAIGSELDEGTPLEEALSKIEEALGRITHIVNFN